MDEIKAEEGFRLVMNRELMAQVGAVEVDYLTGPFRRGFSVKTKGQGASCSSGGCSC